MTKQRQHTEAGSIRPGLRLFIAFFLLYALVSPGNLAGDTEVRWSLARQIVRGNGVHLEDDLDTNNYVVGLGGKRYSYYNLGQSICLLPFAALSLAVEAWELASPATADLGGQFLASLIFFPAVGAGLVWLFYRLILLLGCGRKGAVITSIVLGAATMIWHHSVNGQEQTQIAALILLALILVRRYLDDPRFLSAWLFCMALGACLVFRSASAVTIFPLFLVVVAADAMQSGGKVRAVGRWIVTGLLGVGPAILFCGWYNYMRFGSVLESGYSLVADTAMGGHTMFESSPVPTLAAMLFSPGKSIFLYNPVLLAVPFCLWAFYRRCRVIAVAAGTAVVANFVFYSFCTTWAGDYAWGIRYQVPVLPLLVLPVMVAFCGRYRRIPGRGVLILASVGVGIQLASVVYNFNLEFVQNPNHSLIPDHYVWDWSQSHLRKRFVNISEHLADERRFHSVPVPDEKPKLLKVNRSEQDVRTAWRVNFFPFKAAGQVGSPAFFRVLLGFWLMLLIVTSIAMARLFGAVRQIRDIAFRDPKVL